MKKRILSMVMALALCLTLLPATAWAEGTDTTVSTWDGTTKDTSWYDSENPQDTYTISTAAQLAGLASLVNEGNTFSGVTIQLDADIDLDGSSSTNNWTPIGTSSNSFQGTFDGQGHMVSGLYVSISSSVSVYAGLFGCVGSGGTVKNLAASGEVSATVTQSVDLMYYANAGGVVGDNRGKVENCSFSGSVSAHVIPANYGSSRWACAGGVVGYNYTVGSITNCYHAGAVTGSSTGNSGSICAGGVAGENLGTVTNCYHGTGTVTGTGPAGDRCVGGVVGLVGYPNSGTVRNCYFLQDQNINNGLNGVGLNHANRGTVENVESKTATAFASGEVAWLLQNGQESTAWVQNLAENGDEYPVLAAFSPDTPAVHRVTFTAGETTDPTYYRNNGGTVSVPALPTGTDYVGWYDGDTKYEAGDPITIENSDIELLAKMQESKPEIGIDYEQEFLTGFADGAAYTIDGTEVTPDDSHTLSLTDYMGKTVSIVRKSTGDTYSVDSDPQELTIPARPGAPTGVQGQNETVDGNHDGKITGVTTAMEYKLSTAGSWTKCTGTEVTGLVSGSYQIRLAATNTAFASAAADVTIATGAARTYTLNVTAPTFDSVAYGYAQPATKAITISSTGNSASTVSDMALSGDTSAFTLNKTDGATVQPGQSDTSYTIQPAAGLNAGTYTATITVTYQDGETAVATVSFTVTQAAQEAPADAPQLASRTTNSITLKEITASENGAAAEYGISTDGGETWTWQTSLAFTKLSSGKEYTFAVRYSATEDGNYAASPASGTAAFSTARPSVVVPTYTPTVEDADNGTVSVTPANPRQGGTVTVTPNPDKGYEVDSITVTDSKGNPVAVTDNGDGTYSFTQPAGKVTISVSYVCDGLTDNCPSYHFADVDTTKWYHLAVDFAVENGLMSGYGNGLFGPNDTLTRAELAQILYNKEERPAVTGGSVFTDVADSAWYANAVIWAAANGIVGGYGNGRFGPGDPITREQLAVMLWRYAGCPAATQKELRFTDADQVSSWAWEAMLWATENGVMNGYSGILNPRGTATRAEAAQMLKNFIENI